jgi:drug/metabolite transporter (DMT)-like permease
MTKRATVILLGFILVLWGSAFPGIRAALQTYSPHHLAALRFLVASAALGLIFAFRQLPRLEWRDAPAIFLNGVVGIGFYNLFLNTGQLTVDAGAASLLVNTAPLWTLLWSVMYLGERPLWSGWVGLIISFIGVSLIALRHGSKLELNHGALLVLGASIAHSVYIVLMKRNVARYGALAATSFAVWTGTLFLLCFSRGLVNAVIHAPLSATALVVYLGLFPAALAYVMWSQVLDHFPASRAVSFLFFVPVTAFLWRGFGWASVPPGPRSWVAR